MEKQVALGSFVPDFPANFVSLCNFCVGSAVFVAKGLYLCYTCFKQKHFSARRGGPHIKELP